MDYYIDGSCKGNPGIGGWALLVIKDDTLYDQVGSFVEPPVTNNMMEITALIHCLCYIIKCKDKNSKVYTDSVYNINCYKHSRTWLGNPNLKNAPFVKAVNYLRKSIEKHGYDLKILKVEGHSDNKWNNEADRLACFCSSMKSLKYYTKKIPSNISQMISDVKYLGNLIKE